MQHVRDGLATHKQSLIARRERFRGLTSEQCEAIHLDDSIKRYKDWIASSSAENDKDVFLSWFDANYPDLFGKYSELAWSKVSRYGAPVRR